MSGFTGTSVATASACSAVTATASATTPLYTPLQAYDFTNPFIHLTSGEVSVFSLLLDVVQSTSNQKQTVLRVAGGWVRDKLLQKDCHDIDIALDNCSGLEFAMTVNSFLTTHSLETRTVAVIQANPEQSKHLETANVKVLGHEIDFVNLRAEAYAESRIPEIRIGTAVEDSLRRDFTINALFYNINENRIEDLTERGLADLQHRTIRTPISPFITFKDDPLRVLRAIRFSSRLHFSLDPVLIAAARDPSIRQSLLEKVSRERIYKECEGMMNHSQSRPALSFLLLYSCHILDSVIPVDHYLPQLVQTFLEMPPALPGTRQSELNEPRGWSEWTRVGIETVYWVNVLLYMRRHPEATERSHFTAEELTEACEGSASLKAVYWAALLLRLSALTFPEKKKEVSFISILLRDGLKMENITMRNIALLIDTAKAVLKTDHDATALSIDDAGSMLRNAKELWRDGLLLATAYHLALSSLHHQATADRDIFSHISSYIAHITPSNPISAIDGHICPVYPPHCPHVDISEPSRQIIDRYVNIERRIVSMGLDGVWLLKPLLDGSELSKVLSIPKGPLIGKIMDEQIRWQIRTKSDDSAALTSHLQSFLATL